MMKKIFLLFFVVLTFVFVKAQSSDVPMATLQHGDKTLVFYGSDALNAAYNAAADSSDVIMLSSGSYSVPGRIQKSISIYGTGFEPDTIIGSKPTVLYGNLYLEPRDVMHEDEDGNVTTSRVRVNGIHIEGVKVIGSIGAQNFKNEIIRNLTIAKCHIIGEVSLSTESHNMMIRQSIVNGRVGYGGPNDILTVNLYIANSWIGCLTWINGFLTMNHSILYGIDNAFIGRYTNNIMYVPLSYVMVGCNNIFIGCGAGDNVQSYDNYPNMKPAAVFEAVGEDGTYAANKTFALKYPDKYLGEDGSQIGLYGGLYPWNKIPSTPRIIASEIDAKTSAEGKLKVNITVEAQTKE